MNLQAAFQAPLTQLFATKVADYQAARPDYPASLFDWLAGHLPAAPQVLDLGAGTGLFTQSLLTRGWEVLAVEPEATMRAACDARLGSQPGYRSAAGRRARAQLSALFEQHAAQGRVRMDYRSVCLLG